MQAQKSHFWGYISTLTLAGYTAWQSCFTPVCLRCHNIIVRITQFHICKRLRTFPVRAQHSLHVSNYWSMFMQHSEDINGKKGPDPQASSSCGSISLLSIIGIISHSECPVVVIPHTSLFAQFPYFLRWNLPSWERKVLPCACLSLPFALPDAHFPWESRLPRTAAAASSACSCCSETGQHGSAGLSLRTDFFFHLSLNILLDCANCGHSISCPLSVPDASAQGPLYSDSS